MSLNDQIQLRRSYADIALIILLIFITIVVQFLFLNPPLLSDQLDYFFWGSRFPNAPEFPDHRTLRLGLLIPLSVLIKVFGYSEAAYYAIPFLSMAVFITGIFLLARVFFSRWIAFLSALMAIFIPNLMLYNGELLPDLPAMVMILFAFYGLIKAGNNSIKESFMKKPLFFLVMGGLLGWAYLIRESIVIIFPMVLVIFFIFRLPARNLVFIAAGFLMIVSIELFYGYLTYGNPLIRFSIGSPRATEGGVSHRIQKIVSFLLIILNKYSSAGYIFLVFACLLGSAVFAIKGKKEYQLFFFWFMNVYSALTLIGLLPVIRHWEGYTILRLRLFRYWIPIIPAWMIGGMAVLHDFLVILFQKLKTGVAANRRFIPAILILFSFLTIFFGLSSVAPSSEFIRNGNDHFLEFREFLIKKGSRWDSIWIDRDGLRALERVIPMYTRTTFGSAIWKGDFQYVNDTAGFISPDEITSGLLMVDRVYMNPDIYDVPEFFFSPPENWCLVFQSENNRLFAYDVNCVNN